jgi:hypothetical protein
MRIKFVKGEQKKFLEEVMKKIGSPSLRELINRGIEASYSSLKNYYSERRLLPKKIFEDLCKISDIDFRKLDFVLIKDTWGQVRGGKLSRKKSQRQ